MGSYTTLIKLYDWKFENTIKCNIINRRRRCLVITNLNKMDKDKAFDLINKLQWLDAYESQFKKAITASYIFIALKFLILI